MLKISMLNIFITNIFYYIYAYINHHEDICTSLLLKWLYHFLTLYFVTLAKYRFLRTEFMLDKQLTWFLAHVEMYASYSKLMFLKGIGKKLSAYCLLYPIPAWDRSWTLIDQFSHWRNLSWLLVICNKLC